MQWDWTAVGFFIPSSSHVRRTQSARPRSANVAAESGLGFVDFSIWKSGAEEAVVVAGLGFLEGFGDLGAAGLKRGKPTDTVFSSSAIVFWFRGRWRLKVLTFE